MNKTKIIKELSNAFENCNVEYSTGMFVIEGKHNYSARKRNKLLKDILFGNDVNGFDLYFGENRLYIDFD